MFPGHVARGRDVRLGHPGGSLLAARPAGTVSPAAAKAAAENAETVLEHGFDLERAAQLVGGDRHLSHGHLNRWPSRVDFRRWLRLVRDPLQDRSAATSTPVSVTSQAPLTPEQAADLYDEVLVGIETNYVDPVPLEPLVRNGLDNLEVALRDAVFVKTNAPGGDTRACELAARTATLKQSRARLSVPDRAAAIRLALTSGELARQAIGMNATPVLLEFACGACDALDDFTSYLTPDKLEDLYAMIDGNFVGLGVELKIDKEGLRLVGVIRGGPAWEANSKVGEMIVEVGGRSIKGLSLDEAANRLQGAEGTTVDLEVRRPDNTGPAVPLGAPSCRRRKCHAGHVRSVRWHRLSPTFRLQGRRPPTKIDQAIDSLVRPGR